MGFYKKGIKGKLDIIFSRYIRFRDNWTCKRCGKKYAPKATHSIHAAHIEGRGKESVRWNPKNVFALCYGCHKFIDSYPVKKHEWFIGKFGQGAYDDLVFESNRPSHFKKHDIEEMIDYYKTELNKLMKDGG